MENINLDSLLENYVSKSEEYIKKDWLEELENWKKHKFNDIHILISYLKFTEVMFNIHKKQMFEVDNNLLDQWVDNAFNCKVDYLNLKDTNLFKILKTFNFEFSSELVSSINKYALSDFSNNHLRFQALTLKILEIDKNNRNLMFAGLFKKYDVFNSPNKFLSLMRNLNDENHLDACFNLVKELNVKVDWSGLVISKNITNPINNLNYVFVKYLNNPITFKNKELSKECFSFYMKKREELLIEQSKEEVKEDFKFFLAINNVPKEEFLIANIKLWPKITLSKEDMSSHIRPDKSLQQILLEKKNWRLLDKYSKSLSLNETDVLLGSVRKSEVELARTIGAVVNILINSESDNDWENFLKCFFHGDEKQKNSTKVISFLDDLNRYNSMPIKSRAAMKEYLSLTINSEDLNKNNIVLESFMLKTLDSIPLNAWCSENFNLLKLFLKEHIKILGFEYQNLNSAKLNFFAESSVEEISLTKFKNILCSITEEEKVGIISELNNYWNENESEFYNYYVNKLSMGNSFSTIGNDTLSSFKILNKIENYIIWLNPQVSLNSDIENLEQKFKKYKDFLTKSISNKISYNEEKENIINSINKTSILWEEMIITQMTKNNNNNNNKAPAKPFKF